jgi:hypothetical protein
VRRRRKRPGSPVPERLARFIPGEWPGGCPHEALQAWRDGCMAWVAVHPDSLPFGEFGGWLDVMREAIRYNRQIPACPHEYRPAVHRVNGRDT